MAVWGSGVELNVQVVYGRVSRRSQTRRPGEIGPRRLDSRQALSSHVSHVAVSLLRASEADCEEEKGASCAMGGAFLASQVLRTLCEDNPKAWALHLVACKFALNP